MKKADYGRIAQFYDVGRRLSERNREMWLALIRQVGRVQAGARVLDLGCGTGRFALPMARSLGVQVTGADYSFEMLSKAVENDSRSEVSWHRQDASCLGYRDASFDLVWMSHLLHHVDSPQMVVSECWRVLRESGALLVRYGAMEQIRSDVEHVLFPEVLRIDEGRTPGVQDVEGWLHAAGFTGVKSDEIVQQTYPDAESRLGAAKARSTSALSMISPAAFREGVERLEEYVLTKPDDSWLLVDRMTLTVGYKPQVSR